MESVESRAKEALEAYLKCNETVKSVYYKKICDHDCDNCNLNYAQGTYGDHKEAVKTAIQALEEVQKYREIGSMEECRAAREKQIPKRAYHISPVDDNDNANVECPACHATTDYAVNVIKRGHCWKCGQLLDWSDDNEID
jgi:hypothetical protein